MNLTPNSKIVIVGGGVAGLATAWALARRGLGMITLVEREESCFQLSSGQNAAILRHATDSPATRNLTRRTRDLLHAPPADLCQEPLVDERGLVVLEGNKQTPLPWWADELLADGSCQTLSPRELANKAPGFVSEGARAWWFPHSGTIDIARLGASLERSARATGVAFRLGTGVKQLKTDSCGAITGVVLEDKESLSADLVVLAAGAWAGELGAAVNAEFPGRPTRRHLFVTQPETRLDPDQPVIWDDAAPFYYRPEAQGLLLCIGDQDDCPPGMANSADPLVLRAARRALARRLPQFEGLKFARAWAATRTMTEDDTPVVGADPRVAGLFWVAALGGHGMSLSLGLGDLAASMIAGDEVQDAQLVAALAPNAPRRDWVPQRDWVQS